VLHAFRHGLVTQLRKLGTLGDRQKQWIGHSSLRTTDLYSHTDQDLEYRRSYARILGLNALLAPNKLLDPRTSNQETQETRIDTA
jgi:integrase